MNSEDPTKEKYSGRDHCNNICLSLSDITIYSSTEVPRSEGEKAEFKNQITTLRVMEVVEKLVFHCKFTGRGILL
jgi:hypothetical protein